MTNPGLTLASPYWLLGLIPVAAVAVYLIWRRRTAQNPGLRFPSQGLVAGLPETLWVKVEWLPDALRVAALSAMVLALARPQVHGPSASEDAQGIDIMLALDTSCSMRAADFQPNDRMFVAKKSIGELVKQRTNDRIGLVVFAGEASTWVPLTLDYSLVAQLLEEVDTNMLPDGTAIGSAIGTALNRLRESDAESRVIILITDGDNNAGSISPRKAAELAQELGVRIYTIMIGRGGAVPFPAGKDVFGRPIFQNQVIPTNPELLEELARIAGGTAYRASDKAELDLHLSEVLDRLEKTRLEAQTYSTPKEELFPFFALAALLAVAAELALGATRLWRFP